MGTTTTSFEPLIYHPKGLIMQGQWPRSHAVVTQLGECQTEDLEAAGSSPAYRTFFLSNEFEIKEKLECCLLYTSDAADE